MLAQTFHPSAIGKSGVENAAAAEVLASLLYNCPPQDVVTLPAELAEQLSTDTTLTTLAVVQSAMLDDGASAAAAAEFCRLYPKTSSLRLAMELEIHPNAPVVSTIHTAILSMSGCHGQQHLIIHSLINEEVACKLINGDRLIPCVSIPYMSTSTTVDLESVYHALIKSGKLSASSNHAEGNCPPCKWQPQQSDLAAIG